MSAEAKVGILRIHGRNSLVLTRTSRHSQA